MRLRLVFATVLAGLGAALALMIARVNLGPVVAGQLPSNEALLIHHVWLGIAGGLLLQLVFLHRAAQARADLSGFVRVRDGLLWGAAGFTAFVLAPWLALPDLPPGRIPADRLLFWLLALASGAGGLWLLYSPGGHWFSGRIAALVLLALPPLAGGFSSAGGSGPPATPGYGELAGSASPDLGVWKVLGLYLLFWLLLGYFSALAARRVGPRGPGKTDPAGPPPTG